MSYPTWRQLELMKKKTTQAQAQTQTQTQTHTHTHMNDEEVATFLANLGAYIFIPIPQNAFKRVEKPEEPIYEELIYEELIKTHKTHKAPLKTCKHCDISITIATRVCKHCNGEQYAKRIKKLCT